MLLPFFHLMFCTSLLASASTHHDDDSKHSHLLGSHTQSDDGSIEEARELLARGQAAMARANHAIVSNPRPNRLQVLSSTELFRARKPPPPLGYHGNATASSLRVRGEDGANGSRTEGDMRYAVPDELIEAARLLSENWNPSDEDVSYDAAAAVVDLQTRFKHKVNDTNMMPPMLQYRSGLTARVQDPPSAFRYSDNTSNLVKPTREDQTGQGPQKRAASDWWMSSMVQRGSSPFAPAGYEVWRNVKDFGAKGKWLEII